MEDFQKNCTVVLKDGNDVPASLGTFAELWWDGTEHDSPHAKVPKLLCEYNRSQGDIQRAIETIYKEISESLPATLQVMLSDVMTKLDKVLVQNQLHGQEESTTDAGIFLPDDKIVLGKMEAFLMDCNCLVLAEKLTMAFDKQKNVEIKVKVRLHSITCRSAAWMTILD